MKPICSAHGCGNRGTVSGPRRLRNGVCARCYLKNRHEGPEAISIEPHAPSLASVIKPPEICIGVSEQADFFGTCDAAKVAAKYSFINDRWVHQKCPIVLSVRGRCFDCQTQMKKAKAQQRNLMIAR